MSRAPYPTDLMSGSGRPPGRRRRHRLSQGQARCDDRNGLRRGRRSLLPANVQRPTVGL